MANVAPDATTVEPVPAIFPPVVQFVDEVPVHVFVHVGEAFAARAPASVIETPNATTSVSPPMMPRWARRRRTRGALVASIPPPRSVALQRAGARPRDRGS